MKQGINFVLPIVIETNLDIVDGIEFIFKQGDTVVTFNYPSINAVRNDNSINLHWSKDMTYKFNTDGFIEMDTRVHVQGSDENPETPIVVFKMNRTLFEEVTEND